MVYEEKITMAATPLLHDQIEKAIHSFYGTGVILGRGPRLHVIARLGCGR